MPFAKSKLIMSPSDGEAIFRAQSMMLNVSSGIALKNLLSSILLEQLK
jgi:hypothetical protein